MSDDDAQCFVVGGRRRGRPPLSPGETSERVCVRLPESDYDLVYKMAKANRVSVPELMRQALRHLVSDQRGGVLRYRK
jgi:predicted HicB family RNase H-like nuclease